MQDKMTRFREELPEDEVEKMPKHRKKKYLNDQAQQDSFAIGDPEGELKSYTKDKIMETRPQEKWPRSVSSSYQAAGYKNTHDKLARKKSQHEV